MLKAIFKTIVILGLQPTGIVPGTSPLLEPYEPMAQGLHKMGASKFYTLGLFFAMKYSYWPALYILFVKFLHFLRLNKSLFASYLVLTVLRLYAQF